MKNTTLCPYCDAPGIPMNYANSPTSNNNFLTSSGNNYQWWCGNCPTPVKFNSSGDNRSIYVLHNDAWYEIIYLKNSEQYLVYQYITNISIDVYVGQEDHKSERKFIVQLPSEKDTITPDNIKNKLLTILVFS
jgi:hypothetical protein